MSDGKVVPNPAFTSQQSGAQPLPSQVGGDNQKQLSMQNSYAGGAPVLIPSTQGNGQVVSVTSNPGGSGPAASGSNGQLLAQQSGQPSGTNINIQEAAVLHPSGGSQSAGTKGSQIPGASQGPNNSPGPPSNQAAGPTSPQAGGITNGPVATSQVYPTNGKGPYEQSATGWNSYTAQEVPTSIIVAPSQSAPSPVSGTYGPTGLPSDVPLVLYPSGGPVKQPPGTELVQIGFLYPLNYDFVWTHDESQQQIFKFLPMAIAFGLLLEIENVTMQTLRAWDTTADLHYITTLCLAWIPQGHGDLLDLVLHTQAEKFYHNPNSSVSTIVSMINTALPVHADNQMDGGITNAVGQTPQNPNTMTGNGAPIGGGIDNTSPVKASSVGIGLGVVCGAAAYGAAMFFVARRYKKRRQSHLRSPSMYSSPVMSHVGPDPGAGAALMSGAMEGHRSMSPYFDNEGRTGSRGSGRSGSSGGRQQISAPVMAENSLGWN